MTTLVNSGSYLPSGWLHLWFKRILLSVGLFLAAHTTYAVEPKTESDAKGTNVVVKPGDMLEMKVEKDSSFDGLYVVREGGYIIMPRIGRIQVGELAMSDAEKFIETAVNKFSEEGTCRVKLKKAGHEDVGGQRPRPLPKPLKVL